MEKSLISNISQHFSQIIWISDTKFLYIAVKFDEKIVIIENSRHLKGIHVPCPLGRIFLEKAKGSNVYKSFVSSEM